MPRRFAEPAAVKVALATLATALAPSRVQIVGGEPLLHPRLSELLQAVRDSGLASSIRLVTNGSLRSRLTEEILDKIDSLHLSVYPGFEPSEAEIGLLRGQAERFRVDLVVKHFDHFREPFSSIGTSDRSLVRRIYTVCKIAHTWHCHTVEDGYFYKCPQAVFMAHLQGNPETAHANGIRIDGRSSLRDELQEYLEAEEPLRSCSQCLGSVGRLYAHSQIRGGHWVDAQARPTEDLLDLTYLEALESESLDLDNLCQRSHWQASENAGLAKNYQARTATLG